MVVRRSSGLATGLPLPAFRTRKSPLQESHLRLLTKAAKREAALAPGRLAPLAEGNLEKPLAMLQENQPVALAKRDLVEEELDLRRTEQHSVLVRLLAARAKLQDLQHCRAEHFPLPPARARQYSQCPDPCAPSRETPVAQKCNRAVRCGGRPIFARYRRPRNRRELADCDSRCSRLRRKRAGPARPFPIAVEDKRRCRPLPFADQDARFANLG